MLSCVDVSWHVIASNMVGISEVHLTAEPGIHWWNTILVNSCITLLDEDLKVLKLGVYRFAKWGGLLFLLLAELSLMPFTFLVTQTSVKLNLISREII